MQPKPEFDVFVSHNSTDTATVEDIARRLKDRGFRVWLDIWECVPGTSFQDSLEQGLRSTSAVAFMFGPDEIRPWVAAELHASIDRAVKGQLRVIPVLLPGHPAEHRLSLFLQSYTWVDMREGITEKGLDVLAWGITGQPPSRLAIEALAPAMVASSGLSAASCSRVLVDDNRSLDALGIAAIKRKLHISSEIIAFDAASSAAMAANTYPCDVLTMLVPLVVDMRWRRGYAAALKRLLKVPETTKVIGDFTCSEASPPCQADNGMLSAQRDGSDRVMVSIKGELAGIVSGLTKQEAAAVEDSVNRYGRLSITAQGGLSAFERIKAIGVSMEQAGEIDKLAQTLYRQRDVLIPLLARWGMPGDKCLLTQEEAYPKEKSLTEPSSHHQLRQLPRHTLAKVNTGDVEEITVRNAWRPQTSDFALDSELLNLDPELIKILLERFGASAKVDESD